MPHANAPAWLLRVQDLKRVDVLLGVLGCLLGALLLRLFARSRATTAQGPRPLPGPPGVPLFGNALGMPTHHEWETFAQWAEEYGDVFSLKVLHKRLVVINSIQSAYDLFERNSSLYADRPYFPMLNDLMGYDWNFGMMRYGERWKRHRKLFSKQTNADVAEQYTDVQMNLIRKLLPKLHKAPDKIAYLFRHVSGAFVIELAYGIKVKDKDDPYIDLGEKAVAGIIEAAVPGAFLVDLIPIMRFIPKWFPGATFRRKAAKWRESVVAMCEMPFQTVKAALSAGTASHSIAVSLLEDLVSDENAPADEEEVIRNISACTYLGGVETISTVLVWFAIAMATRPEIQRKAQAEADSVLEAGRLPDLADRPRLPYVCAMVKELFRWNPVAPLAIPHRATEDNIYNGRLIHKGSLVIGNAWAILHDSKVYGPNVFEFDPGRFLKPGVPYPDAAFGFGRRICPGRHLAENFIFIAVASILKLYDITQARDGDGELIPIDLTTVTGTVAAPKPFKCDIKPRSKGAAEILEYLENESV